jgi:hypothetical protein
MIDQQKPWFLALTLESLELLKLGYDPRYGIDSYFLSKKEMMKVVAFNGSSRKDGNMAILLNLVLDELKKEGIETELIQLVGETLSGCIACYRCVENKDQKCAIVNDRVNEYIAKMHQAQGILLQLASNPTRSPSRELGSTSITTGWCEPSRVDSVSLCEFFPQDTLLKQEKGEESDQEGPEVSAYRLSVLLRDRALTRLLPIL